MITKSLSDMVGYLRHDNGSRNCRLLASIQLLLSDA
jgi:hypothetical protein